MIEEGWSGDQPLAEQSTLAGRLFRTGRFGMALGFLSVAVLNVALDPNSAEDDIWFSIYVSAVGFALLWGEREGTGDRRQWFGLGGGVAVALALFFLWLGAEGLFGTPAEPIPWLLGIAAVVTGAFAILAGAASAVSASLSEPRWSYQDEEDWQSENPIAGVHHVDERQGDQSEPCTVVELNGSYAWRNRYLIRVSATKLEISCPVLFGRSIWTLPAGSAIAGPPSSFDENYRRIESRLWAEEAFSDILHGRLIRPGGLLWPTLSARGLGIGRGEYAHLESSVTLEFDQVYLTPKVRFLSAWMSDSGIASFCQQDRRLVLSTIDLSERVPGQLCAAMEHQGWIVNQWPEEWGNTSRSRLVEHVSGQAVVLASMSRRLTILLWIGALGYFPAVLLLATQGERSTLAELGAASLALLFVVTRLLRRRYWTLFTQKYSIVPVVSEHDGNDRW